MIAVLPWSAGAVHDTLAPPFPDGIAVTARGVVGTVSAVIRPIELLISLVNHNAPSGPVTIVSGCAMPVASYMVAVPPTVIRPTEFPFVNHKAPSGPAVIPVGPTMLGPVYLVTTPAVVIRPIEREDSLVNHRAPSGPVVILDGLPIPVPV